MAAAGRDLGPVLLRLFLHDHLHLDAVQHALDLVALVDCGWVTAAPVRYAGTNSQTLVFIPQARARQHGVITCALGTRARVQFTLAATRAR